MKKKRYAQFASIYDSVMQGYYVRLWWKSFQQLAKQHQLSYTKVIDVAGGTGDVAGRFLEEGKTVAILDQSQEMLRIAKRKFPRARCYHQTLSMLSVKSRYDLAVCCFGGLHYLKSQKQLVTVFRKIRKHLKPGGVFCFDQYSPGYLRYRFGNPTQLIEGDGFFTRWQSRWHAKEKFARIMIEGFEGQPDAWHTSWIEQHDHYAFSLSTVQQALRSAGFVKSELYELKSLGKPKAKDDFRIIWTQNPEKNKV